ncbi:MBL fold metallo-hydrolase [Helicobacter sp. 11S02629-2]|uniref:MBL fold metallo-hydrolase n=1 Tax=Helicobacter sp. 11S02629-2 TaxID=1476195 RepID=UPI000BA67A8A|nr:MBL fold metallo-hydrolase [Helicobacter sp. 11S02629-2]PAF45512.1 hypothetical protein BKH40_03365 [Helicobacter sp. 11S02629-2]
MEILRQAFGRCETNCYIVKTNGTTFIIDPGEDSAKWVLENAKDADAVLITHGHFDHIWDLHLIKEGFKKMGKDIKVYCPKEDAFMLENDNFNLGLTPCKPDVLIEGKKGISSLTINGVKVNFHHFPGHTPGCSMIEIDGEFFSGDFIFKRSIGRYDFDFSNAKDMKESLQRFQSLKQDGKVYPGHGESTSIKEEHPSVDIWLSRM